MKRLKAFIAILLVVACFLIPNVSLAYDDYCTFTEDGEHDFTFTSSKANRHPHEGFRECLCGETVYFEESYFDECEKCRKQLCEEGIHYYLAKIYYADSIGYSGYGKCYCGKKRSFSSSYDPEMTYYPYPGVVSIGSRGFLVEEKHPHREYDEETGTFFDDSFLGSYLGECGVCELQHEYWYELEEYEIDTIIYDYDDYWDEDDVDFDYYDYDTEYEDDEDDDFYEWLELIQDILKDN